MGDQHLGDGVIGHGLDSRVTLYVDAALATLLEGLGTDLRALFIVSQLVISPIAEASSDALAAADVPGLSIAVEKARGEKCERCWIYSEELNSDPQHPNTCPRCAKVLREMGVYRPARIRLHI